MNTIIVFRHIVNRYYYKPLIKDYHKKSSTHK